MCLSEGGGGRTSAETEERADQDGSARTGESRDPERSKSSRNGRCSEP